MPMEQKKKKCERILDDLNNNKTKVIIENDIKGNYYSYINDTIYLNGKENKKSEEETVLLCHECYHSVQSKTKHALNMIISSIEPVLFIILLIFAIINKERTCLNIIYFCSLILSIIIRTNLEQEAINKSFSMATKYENEEIISDLKEKSKKYVILQFFNIFIFKLIRGIIILVLC